MTDVPNRQAVELNFDTLREKGYLWIRRASTFMSIGSNAAAIRPPIGHQLDERQQFNFMPAQVTEAEAITFVDEFASWTISNGLRELTEGHSGFLIDAYAPAYVIAEGEQLLPNLVAKIKAFERLSVVEQRAEMFKLFGTDDEFVPMFKSITQARNCLAHRNGVVGHKDIDPATGTFTLRWRFSGMHLAGVYLDLNAAVEPIVVGDNGAVTFERVDRARTYQLGEHMKLSKHDLAEICFGFTIATEMLLKDLKELGQANALIPPDPPAAPAA